MRGNTNEGIEIMKKAFTLIELLVVIAIIAILAAILFPVFAQAKVAAKKTADLSNQKNINMASTLYSADADDNFPLGVYFRVEGDSNSQFLTRDAIHPYVKSGISNNNGYAGGGGIWLSPGQPAGPNGNGASYQFHGRISPVLVFSWGASTNFGSGGRPAGPSAVSQTQIDNLANKLSLTTVGTPYNGFPASAMQAAWWYWSGKMGKYNPATKTCEGLGSNWPPIITGPNAGFRCINTDGDPTIEPGALWLSGSMPRFRFNDGANVGFADGHAKYQTAPQFNWCTQVAIAGINNWASNDPTNSDYNVSNQFQPGNVCGNYIGQ
jgi:prepilin-type N-terminal cleavage/methylation domain-containing protein/prepilin-type processing-associated H-X9-DG protein